VKEGGGRRLGKRRRRRDAVGKAARGKLEVWDG
jgi:hypothetical protein